MGRPMIKPMGIKASRKESRLEAVTFELWVKVKSWVDLEILIGCSHWCASNQEPSQLIDSTFDLTRGTTHKFPPLVLVSAVVMSDM